MLSKLLKYDFKSIKRFGIPAVIALAALTLLSGIGSYLYVGLYSDVIENESEVGTVFLTMGAVFLLIAVITVIYVASIGIMVIIMVDFYKFTATDEAYLTFTLPVKPSQIIWSKFINAYLWQVVASMLTVTAFFSLLVGVIAGVLSVPEFNGDPTATVGSVLSDMAIGISEAEIFGNLMTLVLTVINTLAAMAHTLLMYFTAIFFGSIISKKHKVLASIGCIFAALALSGAVRSVGQTILYTASIVSVGANATVESYVWGNNIVTLIQILYYIGMSVLFFFVLKHMMEKKLNLP